MICTILSCLIWYSLGEKKPAAFISIDSKISDAMFRLRGPLPTTGEVVIIDIDEKSLSDHGQWPWSRKIVAELVEIIDKADAKVFGFDFIFAEKDRTSPASFLQQNKELMADCLSVRCIQKIEQHPHFDTDELLGKTLADKSSVLGYTFLFERSGPRASGRTRSPAMDIEYSPKYDVGDLELYQASQPLLNTPKISRAASEGFLNVFAHADGTVREAPLLIVFGSTVYPSLPLEMVRVGDKSNAIGLHINNDDIKSEKKLAGINFNDFLIRTDTRAQIAVNFRGPSHSFLYLSASDILNGKDTFLLKDKYILLGSSAVGIIDLIKTPFTKQLPGVELHATIIDNLLAKDPMVQESFKKYGFPYILIIGLELAMSGFLAYLGPFSGFFISLLLLISPVIGNYLFLFQQNTLFGLSYLLVSLLFVLVTVTLFNYFFEGRRRLFIKKAFSHYISPSIVNSLLKKPSSLNLSLETKEVTILFCDIRDFTTISETTPPAELGRVINRYFSLMTSIILRNHGMVDKFIGDAIMAVWGSPVDDPDHAKHAVQAALEMAAINKECSNELSLNGLPLRIGIGINSGKVSAGNVGSSKRFDYTVLGDNVNLASRIEKLTKHYPANILISESTKDKSGNKFTYNFIDKVSITGRNSSVKIFQPSFPDTKGKAA